jgi:hypothetical protein
LAISSNWLIVNAPSFGILIAKNQTENLKYLFKKSLVMALTFAIVGTILMLITIRFVEIYYLELAIRILPLKVIALLSLTVIINTSLLGFSTYFRAHKLEPLIYVYALSNAFILITSPFAIQNFGTQGLVLQYLLVLGLIQFPLSLKIFFNFNKKYYRASVS